MVEKQSMGIVHPGAMGVSIAVSAQNTGHTIYWASDGRSPETRSRAEEYGFTDVQTLANLCEACEVIICVCPPDAAESVAQDVVKQQFRGLYIDANAISPQRAIRIGQAMTEAGMRFVDGGIIGGPAWTPGSTWLYLSGTDADTVAGYFSAGALETSVIGTAIGKASALKMCFAAYTKGTTALLCGILAAAESLKVRAELEAQWSRNGSDFAEQSIRRVRGVTAKAWRFAGEMDEIASTFAEVGLPDGFHAAAGDIYQRIRDFKDADDLPALDDVLTALLNPQQTNHTG